MLHDHGVVHRDVKPENLLLASRDDGSPVPRVVIADLGMAKALAESSGLTVTAGTPAYMAPEQAHGSGGFDQRADVYAIAAVTYTLLAGRPPFAVDGGVVSITRRDPSLAPLPVAPGLDLPSAVDKVLAAALAHDPARRPQSAATMADQLDALIRRIDAEGARYVAPRTWSGRAVLVLALATFVVFAAAAWVTLQVLG